MDDIIKRLVEFRDKRNWKQFHTPEHLANSIAIEAAELLMNYQFPGYSTVDINNVKEELADIMAYCYLMAEHYNFDIKQIMHDKISKNEEKYPVDKAYGKADKYNKL